MQDIDNMHEGVVDDSDKTLIKMLFKNNGQLIHVQNIFSETSLQVYMQLLFYCVLKVLRTCPSDVLGCLGTFQGQIHLGEG